LKFLKVVKSKKSFLKISRKKKVSLKFKRKYIKYKKLRNKTYKRLRKHLFIRTIAYRFKKVNQAKKYRFWRFKKFKFKQSRTRLQATKPRLIREMMKEVNKLSEKHIKYIKMLPTDYMKQKGPHVILKKLLAKLRPGFDLRRTMVAGRLYHLPVSISENHDQFKAAKWVVDGATDPLSNDTIDTLIVENLFQAQKHKGKAFGFLREFIKIALDQRHYKRFLRKRQKFRLSKRLRNKKQFLTQHNYMVRRYGKKPSRNSMIWRRKTWKRRIFEKIGVKQRILRRKLGFKVKRRKFGFKHTPLLIPIPRQQKWKNKKKWKNSKKNTF